jgi:ankyrin repeat protein
MRVNIPISKIGKLPVLSKPGTQPFPPVVVNNEKFRQKQFEIYPKIRVVYELYGELNKEKSLLSQQLFDICSAKRRVYNCYTKAYEDYAKSAQLLVEQGANVEAPISIPGTFGYTALEWAVVRNKIKIVKAILEGIITRTEKQAILINRIKEEQYNQGIEEYNLIEEKVELLKARDQLEDEEFISLDAEIREKEVDLTQRKNELKEREQSIIIAAKKKGEELKLLTLNTLNAHGYTILDYAKQLKNSKKIVKLLEENGAISSSNGPPPTLEQFQPRDVHLPLPLHIKLSWRFSKKYNKVHALHNQLSAIIDNLSKEIIELSKMKTTNDYSKIIIDMIRCGANPFTVDLNDALQQTPLHYAARSNKPKIIESILTHTAPEKLGLGKNKEFYINFPDKKGSTPLHYATQLGNIEAIKILLLHGANMNLQDIVEETVFTLALKSNNHEAIRMFLTYDYRPTDKELASLSRLEEKAANDKDEDSTELIEWDSQEKDPVPLPTDEEDTSTAEYSYELLGNGKRTREQDYGGSPSKVFALDYDESELLVETDEKVTPLELLYTSSTPFSIDDIYCD